MSILLEREPFGSRDEQEFLREMNALTAHHLRGCIPYSRIWRGWSAASRSEDIPFLHVGIFKDLELVTGSEGRANGRTLLSSGTSNTGQSRIRLDGRSSELQKRSATRILENFAGTATRPLLILDSAESLRKRGEIAARTAAAMSLAPLASGIHFVLDDPDGPQSTDWNRVAAIAEAHSDILVYGFTSILWEAWAMNLSEAPKSLSTTRITFLHSGGWKKLQAKRVSSEEFDRKLAESSGPGSNVIDFYGLVEQVGMPYPLCGERARHVPLWADVLVRDPYDLHPIEDGVGLLQLMNTISFGAPYHSVLTEDFGRLLPGACLCGRQGKRFELLGRVPKSEPRGCANV